MTTTTRILLLGAILLAAPLNQATAAPTPTVSASVSGYTAIGSGAIPESQWVPLAVELFLYQCFGHWLRIG